MILREVFEEYVWCIVEDKIEKREKKNVTKATRERRRKRTEENKNINFISMPMPKFKYNIIRLYAYHLIGTNSNTKQKRVL